MADRIDILDLIQIGQAPSTFFPEGMDAASFEAFTSIFATAASAEAGTVDLSGVVGAIEGQKAILDLALTYEDGTTGEKLSLLNVCNQQVDLVRMSVDALREIIRQGLLDESGIEAAIEAIREAMPSSIGGTGLQAAELSDELWTGQTAIIAAEILYIDQLQAQFRAKRLEVEKDQGILYDFFSEIIEATLGTIVADIIAGYIPALAPIAGFLTEFGIGFLMDQLAMLLMNGNAMLDGIKAEDVAIKDMTKSIDNYTYREHVILRHIQQIDAILRQINEAEAALRQEIKITQPAAIDKWDGTTDDTTDETYEGWDSVVSSLESSIAQIETWMKGIEDGDAENLPIPAPPQLPTVPDGAGKAITLKVGYLLVKYLITFVAEAHRKARETDTHLTDLVEAVNDLKFNGVRFHTSAGDMVELTGIGTVAESYDS